MGRTNYCACHGWTHNPCPRQDMVIARARRSYHCWMCRPWYVKLWDRIASEYGYVVFRLRGGKGN